MRRTATTGHTRFLLLDANVVAGYYLPQSLNSPKAQNRVQNIIDAVRNGAAPEVFLFMPTLCIAEVFSVFARYCFAKWDQRVKKNLAGGLHSKAYRAIRRRFRDDLHNGKTLQQVDLNRYHILATDLIAPVDAYYEYYRHRTGGAKHQKRMMQAADHCIIGMGIHLARMLGRDNFAIVTADHRLADILGRATSVKATTAGKLGLITTARELGLNYGASIYPRVLNLAKAADGDLETFFGVWPLPLRPAAKRTTDVLSDSDQRLLAKLRELSGIPRDQLPYTQAFEDICRDFELRTERRVDRHEAWLAIGRVEKKGASQGKTKRRGEQ